MTPQNLLEHLRKQDKLQAMHEQRLADWKELKKRFYYAQLSTVEDKPPLSPARI